MNKKNTKYELESLRDLLGMKSTPNLKAVIHSYAEIFSPGNLLTQDILGENDINKKQRNELRNALASSDKGTRNIDFFELARELDAIDVQIKRVNSLHMRGSLEFLHLAIENFRQMYQNYIRERKAHHSMLLSLAAANLRASASASIDMLNVVYCRDDEGDSNNNQRELELYLSNVITVEDYGIKLTALAAIYSEVAGLLNISESENPFTVTYLEDGSLIADVLGHPAVVAFLVSVLTLAGHHYVNAYTKTGRLQLLPPSAKVAAELLQISEQLSKSGIDTSDIEESIYSSTRKISRQLDTLLGDQAEIMIDSQTISVPESQKNLYLEQARQRLLNHEKQDSTRAGQNGESPEAGSESDQGDVGNQEQDSRHQPSD